MKKNTEIIYYPHQGIIVNMKLQLIWPILLMGLLSYYYSPVECRRRGGGRQRLPIKDEEGSRHVDKRKKASGMKMNPI